MPEGLSNRGFAALAGVSEGAVRKGDKTGRIKRFADGSINPDASLLLWQANGDPARTKVRTDSVPVRGPAVRTEDDAKAAVALISRVLKGEGAVDPGEIDFNSARTADTILKAYERDLKIAQRRKELVPHAAVTQHLARSFIGYRQAMQRMPSRHVPEMAAALGCDPGLLDALMSKAIATELNELSGPVIRV